MNEKEIKKVLESKNTEKSVEDIAKYDLVSIADLLLKSVIENSQILQKKNNGWNEKEIKEARVVLGYLNSLQTCFGRKLQQTRLDMNINDKVKAIKNLRKRGHFK